MFELVTHPSQRTVRAFQLSDQVLVDDMSLGLEALTLLRSQHIAFAVEHDGQDNAKQRKHAAHSQPLGAKTPGLCGDWVAHVQTGS